MCDVDAFKAYNDHYGHQACDESLKQVAAALQSCCRRPADMVARYGGEEFAIILPDTELAAAARIAEAARSAVARLNIAHAHSPAASYVSISGGVAVLLGKGDLTTDRGRRPKPVRGEALGPQSDGFRASRGGMRPSSGHFGAEGR
jgi:diguanylate cyclase (GGDEF)-like protein